MKEKQLILDFMDRIWNERRLDLLPSFLDEDFTDYSLPPGFPKGREGIRQWIVATGKSFQHHTIIEDIIAEGNKISLRIKMQLRHIGLWRGYAATGIEIETAGYRFFEVSEDRIVQHWGLIDGNLIEQKISGSIHGCRLEAIKK